MTGRWQGGYVSKFLLHFRVSSYTHKSGADG